MNFVIVGLFLLVVGVAFALHHIAKAPKGYETEQGFEVGEDPRAGTVDTPDNP